MPFGRRIHLASYFEDFVFIIDVDVLLLLLLFTQREREKEPSAHQRDTKRMHKHTHRQTESDEKSEQKSAFYATIEEQQKRENISVPRLRDQGNFLQLRAQFDGGV